MKKIAVIVAGGRGTRLWPMSRVAKPKQFQALVSDRTMLQETFDRLLPVFAPEDIYVATNDIYMDLVSEQLPEVSAQNIIGEPALRDTASAVALICAIVAARHPEAVVAMFPADHVITNPGVLQGAIGPAIEFLGKEESRNYIVTFGIRPLYPETGFGYVKRGQQVFAQNGYSVFGVDKFVEKPDLVTAKSYLTAGDYEWNAGMFLFRAEAMIEKFRKYAPDTYARLIAIREAVDTPKFAQVLQEQFMDMEKVSIDYAILEKDTQIAVIPLALNWSDIGSWSALKDMLSVRDDQNVSKGEHIDEGSENLLVYADKPIVTIGLKDIVIVQMDDVTLVCDRKSAQQVSGVVKGKLADSRKDLL